MLFFFFLGGCLNLLGLFCLGGCQGLGVAAGGIVGASGELAKTTVANDHAAAALFANNVGLLGGDLNALLTNVLFCLFELYGKILPELFEYCKHF